MFLRNYYNMQAIRTLAYFHPIPSSAPTAFPAIFGGFEAGKISLKRVSGTTDNVTNSNYEMPLLPKTYIGEYSTTTPGGSSGNCIAFGTGTTAVTLDDYKLDSPIAFSIIGASADATSISVNNVEYDANTDTLKVTYSIAVTNKSDSAVTITEFGLASNRYYYYREVLTTPFTLAAGETKAFTYTINCSIPEAS